MDDFGYWLWDFENQKIIRSRDVIFNEKVMYKKQMQEKKHEHVKKEYVVLNEIPNYKMPLVPDAQQQQVILQTLASVRCSTRLTRPPERFSPSLYSILLTNSSEPKGYEEAM